MQITRQADYATRAILHLARAKTGERISTSQVAKEQKIPPSFLAKIISQLAVAGLLHTSRGAHGGITLAREPSQITLLEVIEAIDGPIQLNMCVEQNGACPFEEGCPLQPIWCDTQNELVAKLRSTNFSQLTE
ncbi:MAG: Rrf2 family transcriptional regulator [Anaerolineales bacterium]|nr:Rrf2 family transcriptional regulator [Anaerolineales bacterium]